MLAFAYEGKQISACFECVLIPCGVGELTGREKESETWRISVVCMPSMSCTEGLQLSSSALDDGRKLTELLLHHPLLCESASYEFMLSSGKGEPNPVVAKRVSPECKLEELIELMQASLHKTGRYFHARSGEAPPILSRDTEVITDKNFVDVQKIFRFGNTGGMKAAVTQLLDEPRLARKLSWASARLTLESKKRIASLPESGNRDRGRIKFLNPAEELELAKYKLLLLSGRSSRNTPSFKAFSPFIKSSPSPDDLVFAILQNADLARRFGLVVDYDLTMPVWDSPHKPISEILSLTFGGNSEKGSASKTIATAVSRHFINSHFYVVQPSSQLERRKFALLTCLKSEETVKDKTLQQESDSERDYALTAFSIDHSLIRDLLLPETEGFQRNLEVPKYENTLPFSGTHPFSGTGVTLFGPKRDLVSTNERYAFSSTILANAGERVKYFENLWNGYRFDVAQQGRPGGKWTFKSIHTHSLKFKPEDRLDVVISETEDYIYKDQRTNFEQPEEVDKAEVDRVGEPRVHPALFTWNGTGVVQQVPWSHEKGSSPYKGELLAADYVRDDTGKVLPRYPTLQYGSNYKIRSRAVFQAGVGLSQDEADKVLEALGRGSSDWKGMEECLTLGYTHTRNRPYLPGTLFFDEAYQDEKDKGASLRFFLDVNRSEIDVWLYPVPLDREEARFHGLLRRVFEGNSNLACVEGSLGEFLKSSGYSHHSCVGYIADPDVTRVAVSSYLLGNYWLDPEHSGFRERKLLNETRTIQCTDVEPQLIGGTTTKLSFGSDDSFKFRPIRFHLKKSKGKEPSAQVSRSFFGIECYEVCVPEGDVVRIEAVPVVTPQMVSKSTFCSEYLGRDRIALLREKIDEEMLDRLSRMPGVTAPVYFEVIHAMPAPLVAPRFHRLAIRDGDNHEQIDVQAYRRPNETAVHIGTGVQIDSRTTGSINLLASWTTYTDDRTIPGPSILGAPSAITESKSVYFGPARDLESELSTDGSSREICCEELYCAEETVIYRPPAPSATAGVSRTDPSVGFCKIEMSDLKHHQVKIQCIAKGRYASRFQEGKVNTESKSEEILVNVPSSLVPMSPDISHVIPLQRKSTETMDDGGRNVTKFIQKLRIYLRRPWDNTGKGEMLAILFDRLWRDSNLQETLEIPSPATSWGEDPVFRTYESETTDNLSPGTLMNMFGTYAKEAKFDDAYPVLLETELTGDAYNMIRAERKSGMSKTAQDYRNVHLVCVRPSYDWDEKLWYVDFDPGDRMRWFRFNTRTFQPNSLPGYHLSRENVTLNFFSTRSDTLTVVKRINLVEIALDTVPYSGLQLRDGLEDPGKRFKLVPLMSVGDGVFVRRENEKAELPPAMTKVDGGNMRYVWKLPAKKFRLVGIWDEFKMKYVSKLEVNEL